MYSMQTRTTSVYTLKELSDEAFRKAIDDNRDINVDHDWWSIIYEGAIENLEKMGFNNPSINFTGFWSQGDGASFTCESIDLNTFLTSQKKVTEFAPLYVFFDNVTAKIKRTGAHYVHANMIDASISEYCSHYDENQEKIETLWIDLENLLTKIAREESEKIYKDLEHYYDDLTTEDAIADALESNDYDFTADGSFFIQK